MMTTRIHYIQCNTPWERWYRASLRHDLRQLGMLDGDETDDERAARLAGPPSSGDSVTPDPPG